MKYLFIISLFILGCTKEEEKPILAAPINDICNEIVVRPNPVEDVAVIEFIGVHHEVSLKLLDAYGTILLEIQYIEPIENGLDHIDLTGQSKGIYFFLIATDVGECAKRFVKN